MRIRRWLLGALLVTGLAAAVRVEREWDGFRSPKLGPLSATPAASLVTLRVGETLHFAAAAKGAVGFTWLLWGRPVSFAPSWSFTAAPEDAGWQQVSLEVTGRRGLRATRSWDVGVVAPTVPEIDALEPAAGSLALPGGERATFRARAHVRGARPNDRVAFEWSMDDRPIFRDEQAAEEAASELALPAPEPGAHRLRLRVTEDGHTASLADWTLDVAPVPTLVASVSPEELAGPPAPSASVEPPAAAVPAPLPPPPRLVRTPGPRRLETTAGTAIVLQTRVEPEDAPVTYRWAVDGKPLASAGGRLDYVPERAGRRRVTLAVASGPTRIGSDAWVVDVRPATPAPQLVRVPAAARIVGDPGRSVALRTPEGPALQAPPASVPGVREESPAAPAVASAATLVEGDVRRWLEEYARAWSRKDVDALRRMGQVRSGAEAAQLERYFRSVDALDVDVHVLNLSLAGERASVEFERTDTVTDPSGRRQQLRLPPIRKEIERTPDGLRFAVHGGAG